MIIAAIITFVVVLGLLIFVHELGHFLVARKSGMKVEEFGFGFPPRIKGFKRNGTLYSINWIPLGGFVKILGEDGQDRNSPNSFGSKSLTKRFLVLVAGVVMNIILAWVLLSINNVIGIPTAIAPENAATSDSQIQITAIAPNSPASEAGIKPGDLIVAVGEKKVAGTLETISAIEQSKGQETTITLQKGDAKNTVTVTPRIDHPEDEGSLGIGLVDISLVKHAWYKAPLLGARDTGHLLWRIIVGFFLLFKGIFTSQSDISGSIAGPLGIAALTKQVSEMGIQYLIQFTAVLSVNLAIINILPLPALDGGRIVFLIIEKIKGSPVRKEKEGLVHTIGFVTLLLLMAAVTLLDILKFKESIIGFFQKLF